MSVLQPEKGQEKFSTKNLFFLQFFHTETAQELSLDNALHLCDYERKYELCLPVIVEEWFYNSGVPSRNIFEINFICFTDMKGASGDICRTSASKVKINLKKNKREKVTILERIVNREVVVIQRRYATPAVLESGVYSNPKE